MMSSIRMSQTYCSPLRFFCCIVLYCILCHCILHTFLSICFLNLVFYPFLQYPLLFVMQAICIVFFCAISVFHTMRWPSGLRCLEPSLRPWVWFGKPIGWKEKTDQKVILLFPHGYCWHTCAPLKWINKWEKIRTVTNKAIYSKLVFKEHEYFLIFSAIILKHTKALFTGYHTELKDDILFCIWYNLILVSAPNYRFEIITC